MPGPLESVKIVDLCRDLAGSYACMLLGDMGAQVVKVEPVGGDPLRSEPTFQFWNRGRRSLGLDLQMAEGRGIIRRLIAESDVLVETFLPGEARSLGVDYDTLSPVNPRLIYCAMPPFGESGPLVGLPADDGVVSAHAGIYGDQGGEGQPPVFVHLPIASYGAAFLAAFAVASALYTREMDGPGQKVEVSWYSGGVAMQSGSIVTGPNVTYWAREVRSQQGANPVYRLYRCQEDWFFIACGNVTFWNKLCVALGIEHLVEDPRYADAPWNIPAQYRQPLSSIIAEVLSEKPRAYWLEYLASYDIPCAPVDTRDRCREHPQVKHNEILVEVDDPMLGRTSQMAVPVKHYETPGAIGAPAPRPGQQTEEILSSLGYSAQQVGSLSDKGIIRLG